MRRQVTLVLVLAASITVAGADEASLAEYPDSSYAYYANYELAVAHDRLGHREAVLRHCRTAAEQNPDSPRIAAFLQELESRPSPTS